MNRAGELYEAYCVAVGGVAYDGKPLPSWAEFSADPAKAKQVAGWEAVGAASMSDGYHSFEELYEHRHALFLMLMRSYPALSWFSTRHADGTSLDGWFIAGIKAPTGDITYHLPERLWAEACATGAALFYCGLPWDGHTSEQVLDRLIVWIKCESARPAGFYAVKDATTRVLELETLFAEHMRSASVISSKLTSARESMGRAVKQIGGAA